MNDRSSVEQLELRKALEALEPLEPSSNKSDLELLNLEPRREALTPAPIGDISFAKH
ncbi:MAG: hypothetical protein ACXW53_14215 [Candidatus Binatia bacterium]